jgi:hypothetical protein
MSGPTIRFASLRRSLTGWICRRRALRAWRRKTPAVPGTIPADLLKLYVYGYINRVRSSRRLEAETHRNIEVIWLLRHLKPDFRTVADFRRDNRSAFRQVFREFVILCRQLDLFGRELLAVDGTRIKAVNNKDRNFTRGSLTKFIREADEKLADYMKRLDESDADEERVSTSGGSGGGDKLAEKIAAIKGKRDRHKALLDELDRTGEDQISLTDPDSRAMARMTKVADRRTGGEQQRPRYGTSGADGRGCHADAGRRSD